MRMTSGCPVDYALQGFEFVICYGNNTRGIQLLSRCCTYTVSNNNISSSNYSTFNSSHHRREVFPESTHDQSIFQHFEYNASQLTPMICTTDLPCVESNENELFLNDLERIGLYIGSARNILDFELPKFPLINTTTAAYSFRIEGSLPPMFQIVLTDGITEWIAQSSLQPRTTRDITAVFFDQIAAGSMSDVRRRLGFGLADQAASLQLSFEAFQFDVIFKNQSQVLLSAGPPDFVGGNFAQFVTTQPFRDLGQRPLRFQLRSYFSPRTALDGLNVNYKIFLTKAAVWMSLNRAFIPTVECTLRHARASAQTAINQFTTFAISAVLLQVGNVSLTDFVCENVRGLRDNCTDKYPGFTAEMASTEPHQSISIIQQLQINRMCGVIPEQRELLTDVLGCYGMIIPFLYDISFGFCSGERSVISPSPNCRFCAPKCVATLQALSRNCNRRHGIFLMHSFLRVWIAFEKLAEIFDFILQPECKVLPMVKTLPVTTDMTLVCNSSMLMEAGTEFEDPGVVACDSYDGDITENVTVTQSLSKNSQPGLYSIQYHVTNSRNFTATATRLVSVVDTTHPRLILQGDPFIPLPSNYTSILQFSDPGCVAVDNTDGILPVRVQIANVTTTDSSKLYTFSYTASDSANNSATIYRNVNLLTNISSSASSSADISTAQTISVSIGTVFGTLFGLILLALFALWHRDSWTKQYHIFIR